MVRTRKRSYGEQLSQSSSNIAYLDNPIRPEMSNVNSELMEFLQTHQTTYLELLGNICSGEDRTLGSMGSMKNKKFWLNFAMTLCRNTRSDYKEGLEVTCQQYCERLRQSHKRIKNTDAYTIDAPLPPFLNQLNSIFGVGRPSTSEGSLRSRGSISSGTRLTELRTTLAELTHAKVFPLEEIERVEEFVTKSKIRLHVFLKGDKEFQGYTVKAFLEKDSHKKTEI